jgi:hypothetical protein
MQHHKLISALLVPKAWDTTGIWRALVEILIDTVKHTESYHLGITWVFIIETLGSQHLGPEEEVYFKETGWVGAD